MSKPTIVNFAAGPAKLPPDVLKTAQAELLDYRGTGISILESTHRGPMFEEVNDGAISLYRSIMNVPDNYKILFLQGGASGQFSAVPLNLLGIKPEKKAVYVVTGTWSSRAFEEAKKYGNITAIKSPAGFTTFPDEGLKPTLDADVSYFYYCDNETIHGVELPTGTVPEVPAGVELVCDMSSNFLSRPIDVSKYSCIIAGVQKNVGCPGVTAVIVREDLIGRHLPITPVIMDWSVALKNNSLYNTPVVFSVYIMRLALKWLNEQGGLPAMAQRSLAKSSALYNVVDNSNGFYRGPVDKKYRSRMNVVIRIKEGDKELEKKFEDQATEAGFLQTNGHRSVGGLRISCYNAITIEEVESFVKFMLKFQQDNQ